MHSEIELKGLSRLSLRMKYLLQFTNKCEDPITKSLGTELLTDPLLVKVGNTFEICTYITVLFGLPILFINQSAMSSMMFVVMGFSILSLIPSLYVLVYGFRLLLYPGKRLMGRDPEGNSLKTMPIQLKSFHNGLFLLQVFSYGLPSLIGQVIQGTTLLLVVILGSNIGIGANVGFTQILSSISGIIFTFVIIEIGIFSGFKFLNPLTLSAGFIISLILIFTLYSIVPLIFGVFYMVGFIQIVLAAAFFFGVRHLAFVTIRSRIFAHK